MQINNLPSELKSPSKAFNKPDNVTVDLTSGSDLLPAVFLTVSAMLEVFFLVSTSRDVSISAVSTSDVESFRSLNAQSLYFSFEENGERLDEEGGREGGKEVEQTGQIRVGEEDAHTSSISKIDL